MKGNVRMDVWKTGRKCKGMDNKHSIEEADL
jgi:hypothetical protein